MKGSIEGSEHEEICSLPCAGSGFYRVNIGTAPWKSREACLEHFFKDKSTCPPEIRVPSTEASK